MRIAVSGASGLLGRALLESLAPDHEVIRLVRRQPSYLERRWDPEGGIIEAQGLVDVDAVVNLSGAGLADRPWTRARKRELLDSRLHTTRTLHHHAAASEQCQIFLSASAVGFYGDTGDEITDESSPAGTGFLAELCQAWEEAAPQVEGLRTVHLRTGQVLSRRGGLLGKQLPLFRAGVGGRIGSGNQWMPWITARDWAAAAAHLLTSELSGPVNLVSPNPVTNAEFVERLGHALRRPTRIPMPLPIVRRLLGNELVDEALLPSNRVLPRALEDDGFIFAHPDLGIGLRAVLAERR